jgi:hypothetical protein
MAPSSMNASLMAMFETPSCRWDTHVSSPLLGSTCNQRMG